MDDDNETPDPKSRYDRLVAIQIRDAEHVLERRKIVAAQEDERHAAMMRQAAAVDAHNANAAAARTIEMAERLARTRADEDVVVYRSELLRLEKAAAARNDRWIAAIERMAAAADRNAAAQERIATALGAISLTLRGREVE